MTMKQPRFSGPDPFVREAAKKVRACTIAIQALCRRALDWRVQGVTGAAARKGQAHIALRYGRVLLYLEDREMGALISTNANEMRSVLERARRQARLPKIGRCRE